MLLEWRGQITRAPYMERDQPRPASTTRPLMKTNWRHQDKDVFQVELGIRVLETCTVHVSLV